MKMVFDSGAIPTRLVNNKPNLIALGLHVYDAYKYIVKIQQYTLSCTVGMLHISPIAV